MQLLRVLSTVLAVLAVALLPGPSHALAAATMQAHESVSVHAHPDQARLMHAERNHAEHVHAGAMHVASAADGRVHTGSHHPCSNCSIACCAPATAGVEAPSLPVAGLMRRAAPSRPVPDSERADAGTRRAMKPPTASA